MNLQRWCANPDNVLCCRRGRVFIHKPDPANPKLKIVKITHIFAYPESKWHNPFKIGEDGTLAEVCAKFEGHILGSNLRNQLGELVGKTLGCFCDQKTQCHTQTLQRLVAMRGNLPTKMVDQRTVETRRDGNCQTQTKTKKVCSRNVKPGECSRYLEAINEMLDFRGYKIKNGNQCVVLDVETEPETENKEVDFLQWQCFTFQKGHTEAYPNLLNRMARNIVPQSHLLEEERFANFRDGIQVFPELSLID
eukprot:g52052.t1